MANGLRRKLFNGIFGLALLSSIPMLIPSSYADNTSAWNFTDLGTMGGIASDARGISADGSVIVGTIQIVINKEDWQENTLHAFRWTKAGGVQDLGTMGGKSAIATGIALNGSIIVGSFKDNNGNWHAFRWTQAGGAQDMGTMGGRSAYANAVSNDGSVIVGQFTNEDPKIIFKPLPPYYPKYHVFRWTQASGVQDLGTMGSDSARATGVSSNGSVIMGDFQDTNNDVFKHVFRWTQASGVQDLGTMGGTSAVAGGISADGRVIAGTVMQLGSDSHFFRWTQEEGAHELDGPNASFAFIRGVSADGSVIVGMADSHAFIAHLGAPVAPVIAHTHSSSSEPILASSKQASNPESLPAAEEVKFKKTLTTGHPAQIYVLAIKMESENHPGHAAKLYQVLIDRFPDSNYTAKAIDKMEAAQKAGQQRQVMQQQMAVQGQQRLEQIAALKQANEDRIAKCTARCDEALSSCNSQKNDRSIGSSLMGYINHDPSIIQRDMVNNLTGPSCEAANQSCKSSCR